MTERILLSLEFIRNMGIRYVLFRIWYEVKLRSGLMKLQFPRKTSFKKFIDLTDWKDSPSPIFFFNGNQRDNPDNIPVELLPHEVRIELEQRAARILANEYRYFSHQWFLTPDWHTHPVSGYEYSKIKHWSEIPDFSTEQGDIKYIWEKSRFSFLYDLIRYDHHFQKDVSKAVFERIEDWIDKNPVNSGPNWRCSQEISLRILNWTFALYYYRYSSNLNPLLFDKIINSIHDQATHVWSNINFSRIAVRNNHAITETLALYLTGLLYPFFPESEQWKKMGRQWFEEEISFQIRDDGTYLQYSMNYHRIVVQLLSWGIRLSELNGEPFTASIYRKAQASLTFLITCQDSESGQLPNYGNNDGALFFPLSESDYRDFRPQLTALAHVLKNNVGIIEGIWSEEYRWLGITTPQKVSPIPLQGLFQFSDGGYYVLRDAQSLTFLRCGNYPTRPFQADNLHLDLWVNGRNIIRDAGSFLYNSDLAQRHYFTGTGAHNTVRIAHFDQMKKGDRFIWYYWIKKGEGKVYENKHTNEQFIEGSFEGFRHVAKGITHTRKVTKSTDMLCWEIEDWLTGVPENLQAEQLWHPDELFFDDFDIRAYDRTGTSLPFSFEPAWNSQYYGEYQESKLISFPIRNRYIKTIITQRNKTRQLPTSE